MLAGAARFYPRQEKVRFVVYARFTPSRAPLACARGEEARDRLQSFDLNQVDNRGRSRDILVLLRPTTGPTIVVVPRRDSGASSLSLSPFGEDKFDRN